MSAVLFIACDVGYGDEGKLGKKKKKKGGELNLGLRLALGKNWWFPGAKIVRGEAKKLFKRLSY